MWIFFSQMTSFASFFGTNVPSMPVLIFTSLCLVPLDGTKTCGFVFSCRAAEQASSLLNLAAYTLAAHNWVAISALLQVSEHGPLPLEFMNLG